MNTQYLQTMLMRAGSARFDSKFTAVLENQLRYIQKKTYDVEYPELKGRKFVPVSNEAPEGAETIVYRQYDQYGMAKLIANYADDLPIADVLVEEFTQKVQTIGSSYEYSYLDLERSAMAQDLRLDARRAAAARRMVEVKIDDIAAFGDVKGGLRGLANNPNVPVTTATTGNWAAATADQILQDLNNAVAQIITTTLEVHTPNTILLPPASFALIAQKRVSTMTETTILRSFLDNNPYITNVDSWVKLNTANAAGTGKRMLVYKRDPEVLTLEIPQEFQQLPVRESGMLAFKVPCVARIAGVLVHYPLAMLYVDGI